MEFKLGRILELVVGATILADKSLRNEVYELQDEGFMLQVFLGDRNSRVRNQIFVDRVKRRYDCGKKNRFYRFASGNGQFAYDVAWHRLGRVIKENQVIGRIGRASISLE